MAKFNVLYNAENLVDYIFTITDSFPKKTRADMVTALRNKSLEIIEYIIIANNLAITGDGATPETKAKRLSYQRDCLIQLRVLNSFIEISSRKHYLTKSQNDTAIKLSQILFDMISGWHESDKKR